MGTVLAMKPRSYKSTSRMRSVKPKRSSNTTPIPQVYLGPLLPTGWQRYFSAKRAGKYWGLRITCPFCKATPPTEIVGARRWRWLSVHVAEHKKARI